MSLTTKVLLALVAGFGVGLALAAWDAPASQTLIRVIEPIGTIFINAIRMTVIPLVVSNLIVGVTSTPDPRVVGRMGARALVFFVVVVGIAAAVESLRAGAAASGATAAESAKSFPTFGESLIGLVPANPIKAAADQWRRSVAGLHVFHTGAVALPNDGWCRWPR